jgi:uncharacterized membrane protein
MMMVLQFLLTVLLWTGIMALIAWLVSEVVFGAMSDRPSAIPVPAESALDVLKRRYARGEISKSQYELMCRDLIG